MVLRSVPACIDSSNWLQGGGMQDPGFKVSPEDMLSSPRPLMDRRLKPNAEFALKCPRCDSANTKFCYYNNYSLSQPRYFCKTCRRYWTKGGTLRNVPVGGGCRKNKRFKRTPDQSGQTEPSAHNNNNSSSNSNINNNNTEINSGSHPNLENPTLSLPVVPSVYFTLLNGGADGLGVAYANRSQQQHNLQALKVAAAAAADRPILPPTCNSSASAAMMLEIPSTSTATHQPLANLSNLSTFQSIRTSANLITGLESSSGPDGSSLMTINGDLTSIFEAHHQNQQLPTSSTPTVSHVSSHDNRFNDVTVNRLNSGLNDQDVQWRQPKLVIPLEDHDSGQVLLPFDHEEELRPGHHDMKFRQLIMNTVQSPLGGGEVCEENRPANSYNWQLPLSEGLLDTSANNAGYWNGAGAWTDLSCYAPYTNPLI